MGYIGNEPTTGHFPVDNFTSSGGSTYTLAKAPATAGAIEVSVQGVLQPTTAYTVSGTTLTMAGVTTGVKIFVRHLGETLVLPTIADGVVTAAKLGTNSVDGTKIAMGSDARGDILYHGATDYARLAKGTSGQILTMGANDPAWAASAAGGKVLQVVQDTLNTVWTTSSTSFTPVVGLSVSITPAATSKVLLMGNLTGAITVSNAGGCCVKRDSTFIHIGDANNNNYRGLSSFRVEAGNNTLSQPLAYLDTHGADGSTAVVYTWQVKAESGAATVYINRSANDSNVTYYGRYASSIIAIEIGA